MRTYRPGPKRRANPTAPDQGSLEITVLAGPSGQLARQVREASEGCPMADQVGFSDSATAYNFIGDIFHAYGAAFDITAYLHSDREGRTWQVSASGAMRPDPEAGIDVLFERPYQFVVLAEHGSTRRSAVGGAHHGMAARAIADMLLRGYGPEKPSKVLIYDATTGRTTPVSARF